MSLQDTPTMSSVKKPTPPRCAWACMALMASKFDIKPASVRSPLTNVLTPPKVARPDVDS